MSPPLVSVIIPVYRRLHSTIRAIRSVLAQSYEHIELIVVDDCSPDDTFERLSEFIDDLDGIRVSLHRTERNHGNPSKGRNIGILKSNGEYIALLDNDDWFLPDKLGMQVGLFEALSEDVGLVYCGYRRVDAEGDLIREVVPKHRGRVFEQILWDNFVGSCTPMVRREVFDEVGLYDEDIPLFEDRDMMIRVARVFDFDFVPDILACYQHGRDQLSRSRKGVAGREYILKKHLKHIKTDSRTLSHHYHWLGCNYYLMDDVNTAMFYENQAIRHAPIGRDWLRYLMTKVTMATSRRAFLRMAERRFKNWGG